VVREKPLNKNKQKHWVNEFQNTQGGQKCKKKRISTGGETQKKIVGGKKEKVIFKWNTKGKKRSHPLKRHANEIKSRHPLKKCRAEEEKKKKGGEENWRCEWKEKEGGGGTELSTRRQRGKRTTGGEKRDGNLERKWDG